MNSPIVLQGIPARAVVTLLTVRAVAVEREHIKIISKRAMMWIMQTNYI